MKIGAILFDFDGVIADSEALANTVLAEHVTQLGLHTTLADALNRYMGRRWSEAMVLIEADIGRPLPPDFSEALKTATLERFKVTLQEVSGATAFIRQFHAVPRCIASSSSADRLRACLEMLGIADEFSGAVYSADMVDRGKPHPDIFLYAAAQLGIQPSSCLVVEDSVSGVQAGKAAGMMVVGLCAASHIREGHSQHLAAAGAVHVANTWEELAGFVGARI